METVLTEGGSNPGTPTEGGTGAPPTFIDQLPEDIRGEAAFKNFTDVGQLAKSYLSAQKMVGADKIPVPGKHATDDDWRGVFKKLGLPESQEKYDVKAPDGFKADENFLKSMKSAAFEAGVLPRQFEKILGQYATATSEIMKAEETRKAQEVQDGVNSLKQEWGNAFDRKVQLARNAAKEYGGDEFLTYLRESGRGNDPHLIKFLSKLMELNGEDKIPPGDVPGFGMTPNEIGKQISRLQGDPSYLDAQHPNHNAAVKEMQAFMSALYPEDN